MSKKPLPRRKDTTRKEHPSDDGDPLTDPISTGPSIFLRLTDGQIAQVVQETGDGGIKMLLSAPLAKRGARKSLIELLDDPLMSNPGISQSVVKSWVVFAAFAPPGTRRGVLEIAKELEMTLSTAHRYIKTLAMLGLLERTVEGRYRMAGVNVTD